MTWRKAVLVTVLCVVIFLLLLFVVAITVYCIRKHRKQHRLQKTSQLRTSDRRQKYTTSESSENPTFITEEEATGQLVVGDISGPVHFQQQIPGTEDAKDDNSEAEGLISQRPGVGDGTAVAPPVASGNEEPRFNIEHKYTTLIEKPASTMETVRDLHIPLHSRSLSLDSKSGERTSY